MPLLITSRPLQVSPGRSPAGDEMTRFGGGLNVVAADDAVGPDQFRRGENGRLTIFGAFIKRGGSQQTAPPLLPGFPIQNGLAWEPGTGPKETLVVTNGTLFATTYGTFPLPWTQVGAEQSLSAAQPTPWFAPFISQLGTECVYIADGGALNKYQGGALVSRLPGTPNCSVLAVHNERLWGAGDPNYPDSIFYSALNDGDSLGVGAAGGGQIIVRTFGVEKISGLRSLGTSLMILHPHGLSRLTGYGQSDVTVAPAGITRDVGTVTGFASFVVDNLLYFVSDRGLYAASEQDVAPVNTPDRPDPLTQLLPTMSAANLAAVRMTLNRGTRELLILVPGFGIYIYHTILKAWAGPWTDGYLVPETTALIESHNENGYPIVLAGNVNSVVVETDRPGIFRDNVAADDPDARTAVLTGVRSVSTGTIITMTLRCRRMYAGDPHIAKAWRTVDVLAALDGSQSTTVTCVSDQTSDAHQLTPSNIGTWGFGTWGLGTWGAANQSSYREPMAGTGYFQDVTITDAGEATPVFSQVRVRGFLLGRR